MQVKPPSSAHAAEQPSPSTPLPSSQPSPGSTFASPQRVVHAVVTPAASRHVGSCVQVFEQPEPSPWKRPLAVPASHDSPASCMPLPQTDWMQTAPLQDHPGSVKHVEEQPSALVVLLSSQFSEPVSTPSPQSGTHFLPGTRHCHPGSTAVHVELQPSPSAVLPSSHVSALDSEPFPHVAFDTHGWPGVGHK